MSQQHIRVHKVAVIGAGASGVATAIRLKQRGIEVKVFERTSHIGGVWVFDERTSHDPGYPSTLPSVGDTPEEVLSQTYQNILEASRVDGPLADGKTRDIAEISHTAPGPAYQGLKNNVSMIEMEMQTLSWDGDEEFVSHERVADYIKRAAMKHQIERSISFNTRVIKIWKEDGHWIVMSVRLHRENGGLMIDEKAEPFDAVTLASGHYHACHVPDIPGLSDWKQAYPEKVMHSKQYRRPDSFRGQNVLLVGAGVSSTDIARELGSYARSIVQVSRGGQYDLTPSLLPRNASRVGAIRSFDPLRRDSMDSLASSTKDGPIPGTVTLETGEKLCDFDRVVLCTGYHVSYPFLRQLHADGCRAADANEMVVVTDGQQTHNLHKDIFYIPDPTLSFIGVPYHVATFSLFDFQAVALATVLSGAASLPSEQEMRREYNARIAEKGAGRNFHSLKGEGQEAAYVAELVALANGEANKVPMVGHSQRWHDAYQRRLVRMRGIRGAVRSDEDELAGRACLPSCR